MIHSQRGFTLIEIMIAITIMAALTVFTAKSVQDALRNSSKYRRQISEASELRDVLSVIEKDINLAFHHRNIQKEILDEIESEKQGGNNSANSSSGATANANQEKEVPNYTRFLGEESSLHFTTLNNPRTISDSKVSDQAEVSYYLAPCRKRGTNIRDQKCLWRRTSPIIDDDIEAGGIATPILEDLNAFELQYIGDAEEGSLTAEPEWVERWDSKSSDLTNTTGKFPNAVAIKLTVNRKIGKKAVQQSLETVASLRFPNNQKPKKQGENQNEGENNAQ